MFRYLYRKAKQLFNLSDDPNYLSYVKTGNISIGQQCDLHSFSVLFADPVSGSNNIKIGNNTCIRGTIIIYKSSSKVIIGDNVYIGPGTLIECVEQIEIGNNALISMDCNIIDTNSHSIHSIDRLQDIAEWKKGLKYKDWRPVKSSPIFLGENCWIGLKSIIMKGVNLNTGCIVAAGSVVLKSFDAYSMIAGNPARFVKLVD